MATALAVIALIGATVGSGEPASAGPQGRSPGDLLIPRRQASRPTPKAITNAETNLDRSADPIKIGAFFLSILVLAHLSAKVSRAYRAGAESPEGPSPTVRFLETLRSYLANQEPPRFPGAGAYR